ncbi:MAG: hypothetical protein AAGE80_15285 [Pseudomonadota bacterium]
MREASTLGRRAFLQQQLIATAPLSGDHGAEEILDNPQDMLTIELAFLWGWFVAFAEDQGEWPTSPEQRATLHIIQYCMDHHGMNLDQARAEGADVDRMWNQAEPLFDAIERRGREAYQEPSRAVLAQVIASIADSRREAR